MMQLFTNGLRLIEYKMYYVQQYTIQFYLPCITN